MRTHRGFSLIELMVAIMLGMVAIAAVGSVFIYGSRSYKEDDRVSRMQDELRFAMAQLTQDLEMAGFYAQVTNPLQNITVDASAVVANDCGPTTDGGVSSQANSWVFQERRASIFTLGDVTTGAAAAAMFPCIDPAEFYTGPASAPGTDIIAVKRLGGINVVPTAADNGKAFLRTNGVTSTLYIQSDPAAPPDPQGAACPAPPASPPVGCIAIYEFKASVWFLRKWPTGDSGAELPSLCRYILQSGKMVYECLAQGIEDLQLEFGVDTNANGVPDFFTQYAAYPGVDAMANITTVRIHLLARATDPDQSYVNTKSYTLATKAIPAFNDKYHRKTLSSIVLLRNPTNLRTPEELPQ